MNAMPPFSPPQGDSHKGVSDTDGGMAEAIRRMEVAWFALHRAGEAVAGLAWDIDEDDVGAVSDFPALIHRLGGWRLRQAEQGIADLTLIMQSGLAALLSVRERGAETGPAAQALWEEFNAARLALIDLAKPAASLR